MLRLFSVLFKLFAILIVAFRLDYRQAWPQKYCFLRFCRTHGLSYVEFSLFWTKLVYFFPTYTLIKVVGRNGYFLTSSVEYRCISLFLATVKWGPQLYRSSCSRTEKTSIEEIV